MKNKITVLSIIGAVQVAIIFLWRLLDFSQHKTADRFFALALLLEAFCCFLWASYLVLSKKLPEPSENLTPSYPWVSTDNEVPGETAFDVIGFHPDWVDEDFNPKGVRICCYTDSGWYCAKWVDCHDCYAGLSEGDGDLARPTHWAPIEIPFKQ